MKLNNRLRTQELDMWLAFHHAANLTIMCHTEKHRQSWLPCHSINSHGNMSFTKIYETSRGNVGDFSHEQVRALTISLVSSPFNTLVALDEATSTNDTVGAPIIQQLQEWSHT